MAISMPKYEPSEHEWRNKAACRDTDPSLFFPVGTTGMALDQVQSAKRVCLTCPSATACLQFALDTNQDAGVWGGLDEEERRVIRRRRRAARKAKAREATVSVELTRRRQSSATPQLADNLLPA